MEFLFSLVFGLAGGLAMSRVVKFLHLPNVTGYLVAGLVLGPKFLNFIKLDNTDAVSTFTSVALGFIAFSIGGEFNLNNLKKLGKSIISITVIQAFSAVLAVLAGIWILSVVSPESANVPQALLLGAIASATAPAATLMVVKQYRAKGVVTDTLLPVVAGDDAVGLMIFSVCYSLARVFANGGELTVQSVLLDPLREIGMSLLIGAAIGFMLSASMKIFRSKANRLCLMILAVFAGVALSDMLDLSSLLTCMMIGAVFCNVLRSAPKILEGSESWTPPLFMLFFVISGAQLDVSIIPSIGIIGIAYLVLRSLGKYFGAFFGAAVVHADPRVKKYLGITLLPQAGVAIGMAQMVASTPDLASVSASVVTVVLSATFIYELIGPVLTKIALKKAGEIEE